MRRILGRVGWEYAAALMAVGYLAGGWLGLLIFVIFILVVIILGHLILP